MAIKFISDSTCDISIEDSKKMGITLVPLQVTVDGKTYLDKFELTNEEFYEKLAACEDIPVTTLAGPQTFIDAFDSYPNDDIICICIASKLSGTYQSALIAKEETGRDNIYVIDSMNVSLGAALLIEKGLEMAENGLSAAEIAAKLTDLAPHIEIYAVLDTLKYLVKGGRLGKGAGTVGAMLGIKPVIRVKEGAIESIAKARGFAKAFDKITEVLASQTDFESGGIVTYGHSNNRAGMERLMADVGRKGNSYFIGSVVGTHAGPGAAAVAVVNRKK